MRCDGKLQTTNSGQIRLIYAQNKCELVQPATIGPNVCVCNRWIVMHAIRLSMVPVIHLKLLIECAHTHTRTRSHMTLMVLISSGLCALRRTIYKYKLNLNFMSIKQSSSSFAQLHSHGRWAGSKRFVRSPSHKCIAAQQHSISSRMPS